MYIVDLIGNIPLSKILFKKIIFFKYKKIIINDEGSQPYEKAGKSTIKYKITNLGFKKLFINMINPIFLIKTVNFVSKKIIISLILSFLKIKPYKHLVSGKISRLESENKFGNRIQIKGFSFDYQIYYSVQKQETKEKYKDKIIFIDSDLPQPFDFKKDNKKTFLNGDIYWKKINNFLSIIEKRFDKKVIIARHPRGNINKKISNYETVQGATANLIKDCHCIVTHNSNALQYAIMFKKPIIFISTDEFENNIEAFGWYADQVTQSMELKKKVINIDSLNYLDLDKQINVNESIYEEYINNWIKEADINNLSPWQKLIDLEDKN